MPPRQLSWLEINDFRPGIQQRVVGSNKQGLPVGSCRDTTYGCCAAPNGALIPMAKRVDSYTPTPPGDFANVQANLYYVNGFHVTGPITGAPVASGSQSEFHIGWEWYSTSAPNPHREYRWERHQIFANPVLIDSIVSHTGGASPTADAVRGTFFEDVRMDDVDPLNPGTPLVAAAWYEEGGAGDKFVSVYPTPVAPATDAVLDISTTLPCDIIAAHQGRLIMFEQRGWSHGSPGSWISNEQIWYTDINLPTIDNTVADTFATDRMTGIGAVKGVSANEILMVKFQGGGFTVSGDFSNPTVIRLPGVMPTYGATIIPVYTSLGLVYGVLAGGVYAWGGGSDSQLLSDALEDGFWQISTLAPWINYHGKFELWRDWIVCPNSWVYDTKTGGWWRLKDSTLSRQFFHYGVDYTGTLYAVPDRFVQGDTVLVSAYSMATKETSYSWASNFLPGIVSPGRGATIREVVVEAVGTGTVTITIQSGDSAVTTQPTAHSFSQTNPDVVRKSCSVNVDGNVGIVAAVAGSMGGVAPTVLSIKLGYYESAPVNPT